jgi:3-isopropylmalate dehydrogenase
MFEYAFDLQTEGKLIREAVAASMTAKVVTEDIAELGNVYKTSEVGEWIVNYIQSK